MTVPKDRSRVVSSFTVIKGTLIGPTYDAFQGWDFSLNKRENLDRMGVGASSANWHRDVSKTLNRRFDRLRVAAGATRPRWWWS